MKLLSLSINGTPIPVPTEIQHISGGLYGANLIQLAFNFAFVAGILISLGYFIYGGFSLITSRGSKENMEKSRQKMVNAILGLIIILLAFFIVSNVGNFFGLKLCWFLSYTCPLTSN